MPREVVSRQGLPPYPLIVFQRLPVLSDHIILYLYHPVRRGRTLDAAVLDLDPVPEPAAAIGTPTVLGDLAFQSALPWLWPPQRVMYLKGMVASTARRWRRQCVRRSEAKDEEHAAEILALHQARRAAAVAPKGVERIAKHAAATAVAAAPQP